VLQPQLSVICASKDPHALKTIQTDIARPPNKQHFRVKDEQIRFREMCLKQNFGGRGVVAKTGAAG